jgi:hypothetical protein
MWGISIPPFLPQNTIRCPKEIQKTLVDEQRYCSEDFVDIFAVTQIQLVFTCFFFGNVPFTGLRKRIDTLETKISRESLVILFTDPIASFFLT